MVIDVRKIVLKCLSRMKGAFVGYFSVMGLKIALVTAFFMQMPFFGYLYFHEYSTEGLREVYKIVSLPHLWIGLTLAFGAFMFTLSKIFILPLKRFELHLSRLEKGVDEPTLYTGRMDEIGYIARRFDRLHKTIKGRIEAREAELSVIHMFTEAASGTFDIEKLMEGFFGILRTAVNFDAGAYALAYKNHAEGRLFIASEFLSPDDSERLTALVLDRAAAHCAGFPKERFKALEFSKLEGRMAPRLPADLGAGGSTAVLPIVYYGTPLGVITLISFSGGIEERMRGYNAFSTMVQHANAIIEKLLTHIMDEEKRLENIMSSMHDGVFILDPEGQAIPMNKRGSELMETFCPAGAAYAVDARGVCRRECRLAPAEPCEFSNVLTKMVRTEPELDGIVYSEEVRNADGMTLNLSVSNLKSGEKRRTGYVVTAKDVTEDRMLQKRIMLSSKLTALGEMAAGIAHEVNNPLQVMMANIELVESSVEEKGKKRLDHLKDGIWRIKNIVRDLLIFAREQTTETEETDLNQVITKAAEMLVRQLKVANVAVTLDLDKRALPVKCNRNLFQQVIINLLQNAKDAIEEAGKGSRVSIRSVMLPGGIVVVEVSDDGPGIPEKIIDRIFDPFFTTKEVGKGTGLGLSVSRRIIEGMGGTISVVSSPRTGTTFTISLLHHRPLKGRDMARKERPRSDYAALGAKTALIVDDEEGIVRAVRDGLSGSVLEVDGLTDGKEAVARLMDRDYDYVVLDVKMPGMNGMELYRNICEMKPYMAERIIFLTGDTDSESTGAFIKLTGCKCLAKPCSIAELMDAMCDYASGRDGGGGGANVQSGQVH